MSVQVIFNYNGALSLRVAFCPLEHSRSAVVLYDSLGKFIALSCVFKACISFKPLSSGERFNPNDIGGTDRWKNHYVVVFVVVESFHANDKKDADDDWTTELGKKSNGYPDDHRMAEIS